MHIGLFRERGGERLRAGVIVGDEVADVTDRLEALGPAGPAGLWQPVIEDPGAIDLASLADGAARRPLSEISWGSPLPRPGKILGAPANYRAHVAEMGNPNTIYEWGMFLMANSSVIGPEGTVELPYTDVRTDHEAELAVVIGRTARNVPRSEALDHVFGYTALLDITIRSTEDRSTRKSFDTFTPIGPWIVTADEIPDPNDLGVRLWVNGEQRQSSTTALMIYEVERLIEYASSVVTLYPGDVIATGTPEGVGPIVNGDRVVCEVERIGRLEVNVSDRQAKPYASREGEAAAASV